MTIPAPPVWAFDIECYINYYLVMARNVYSGELRKVYELFNDVQSPDCDPWPVGDTTYVSFNGMHYDHPMLSYGATGASNAALKALSDAIILKGLKHWQASEEFGFQLLDLDHIDLIEVAPGVSSDGKKVVKTSLKVYAGRLHSRRLQDLPITPSAVLTYDDVLQLRDYCGNSDLVATCELYHKIKHMLDLRVEMGREFGLDLRSKSDAQMAETIIKSEVEKRVGRKVYKPDVNMDLTFNYKPPAWVKFQTPGMQHALALIASQTFSLLQHDTSDHKRGSVITPKAIEGLRIKIGKGVYTVGIGGLHSTEKSVAYSATDTVRLVERDVISYYPRMIINSGVCPPALGEAFMPVYEGIVNRRVAAKEAGNKMLASGLKICCNGPFGKLLSMYSVLYAPEQGIAVTITGQLALLMLIELLEVNGFEVISANTDGVVTKVPTHRTEEFNALVSCWELTTGLQTEEAEYSKLCLANVNNYIAVKPDGEIKLKGWYTDAGMQKNPTNAVCTRAVIEKIAKGTPVESTIFSTLDVRDYLSVRNVKGGAVYGDQYLGKAVRWYYAKGETRHIAYKLNGNKVARTDGARPLMTLSDALPADLDYQWYIDEANSILGDIGL